MNHITQLVGADTVKERRAICKSLRESLEQFSKTLPYTIPLLGLNEIAIWAESKEKGISIRDIFLQRVEAHMRLLEGLEKVG